MIVIINYGMGNLCSIENAIKLLQRNVNYSKFDVLVTENPEDLRKATAIILPGVGAFGQGMKNLKDKGFISVLNEEVIEKKKPFLGICLGMQFLANFSEEHGHHKGLAWVDAEVKLIETESSEYRVPHIGWNDVEFKKESGKYFGQDLFKDFFEKETFYFVHSFCVIPNEKDRKYITSITNHGTKIVASVQKGNVFGTQFHPEKSQGAGMKILNNFIDFVYGSAEDKFLKK